MTVNVAGGVNLAGQPIQGRLGRKLHERHLELLTKASVRAAARRASIQTDTALIAEQQRLRGVIAEALGRLPAVRPPLNPRTTSMLVRSGYAIENVLYESMPGWLVSANLYIPNSATSSTPAPGILVLCGHDTRAKWYYQDFGQGLARLGYVALVADPVGGGERLQIPSPSPGVEHKQFGRQLPLVSRSMAGLQAWDASRGIDYLLTRPEVDPQYIGATGNSGGGVQAVLVTALDSRVTMSAPSCFVTTALRTAQNEIWADHEATPLDFLGEDLDYDDLLVVLAPKPIVLIGQIRDYWEIRGLREIHQRLSNAYALLGAPAEACQLYIDNNDHQLDRDGRQAAYRLFNYATGGSRSSIEPTIIWEPSWDAVNPNPLQCTVTRDVGNEPGAIRSVQLMAQFADEAILERGSPRGEILKNRICDSLRISSEPRNEPPDFYIWEASYQWTINGWSSEPAFGSKFDTAGVDAVLVNGEKLNVALNNFAGDTLGYREKTPGGTPADHFSVSRVSNSQVRVRAMDANDLPVLGNTSTVRIYNFGKLSLPITPPNYPTNYACAFAIESEPGILVPTYYLSNVSWHSPLLEVTGGTPAILYVSHVSADQELADHTKEILIDQLRTANPNTAFFAMDCRDTGECKPNLNATYPDDFSAQLAESLGRPLLGGCVWDILRVIDFLAAYGYTSIHLAGKGWGAIPAAIAGVLDDRVVRVTLKNSLTRWEAVARAHPNEYSIIGTRIPSRVLNYFDLPDVYAELVSKQLDNQVPWGARQAAGGL